jgi:hypothetical protein
MMMMMMMMMMTVMVKVVGGRSSGDYWWAFTWRRFWHKCNIDFWTQFMASVTLFHNQILKCVSELPCYQREQQTIKQHALYFIYLSPHLTRLMKLTGALFVSCSIRLGCQWQLRMLSMHIVSSRLWSNAFFKKLKGTSSYNDSCK